MKLTEALRILSKEDSPIPSELTKIMQEMKGSRKSASIFLAKYCDYNPDTDELLETSKEEVYRRVSYNIPSDDSNLQSTIFNIMINNEAVVGGRIAAGVGIKGRLTAFNCYVGEPPKDKLHDIFRCLSDMAETFSYGGGYGFDLSNLRPKGTSVSNAARRSSGPVSFMDIFSKVTAVVGQHNRRGALMMTMSVDHPDIFDFINVKQFDRESIDDAVIAYVRGDSSFADLKSSLAPSYSVNHSNISVRLTDKFMKAVEKDGDFELRWEGDVDGESKAFSKIVKARELWNNIIKNAWATGEPGLLFWDKMKAEHNGEYYAPLSSTNPCSEQPLPMHGNCLLLHINLSALVSEPFTPRAAFNFDRFREIIPTCVRYLDAVVDYNAQGGRQALQAQDEASVRDRRLGLGITGLGDTFFKLGLAYGNKQSRKLMKEIMLTLAHTAYRTSIEMAKEKGPFPAFDAAKFLESDYVIRLCEETDKAGIDSNLAKDIKKFGLRNVTLLTIAPVGTGSEVLGGVSSGVEPIFAPVFTRRVKFQDGDREFTEYVPVLKEYLRIAGSSTLPDYLVTAHDLTPELRVELQGVLQMYVDSAISSTVNLPNSASVDDVAKIYMMAWKSGLKGITVYREGSREGVLRTGKEEGRPLLKKLFRNSKDMIAPLPTDCPARVFTVQYCPTHKARVAISYRSEEDPTPIQLLVTTKKPDDEALAKFIGMSTTALLRRDAAHGIPSDWIINELEEVVTNVGAFHKDDGMDHGVYVSGLSQAAAFALKRYLEKYCNIVESTPKVVTIKATPSKKINQVAVNDGYEICPSCRAKALVKDPCEFCHSCGWSRC